MRRLRQIYYDHFSRIYDRFAAMHSSDKQGSLREYLAEKIGVTEGCRVLDICTGTGSLLIVLKNKTGKSGLVVGIDFSRGMLEMAKRKTSHMDRICLIRADASHLPFKNETFDAVTCAHAFYELRGRAQDLCLKETVRLLKKDTPFLKWHLLAGEEDRQKRSCGAQHPIEGSYAPQPATQLRPSSLTYCTVVQSLATIVHHRHHIVNEEDVGNTEHQRDSN